MRIIKSFSKEKAQKLYHKRQKQFTPNDINKIIDKVGKLELKFTNQSRLTTYIEDFRLLFSMLKDYYQGKYKAIPWHSIAAIGATLLYILNPFDALPDFIPFVGYIDDAAVFNISLNFVRKEIIKYKNWKNKVS